MPNHALSEEPLPNTQPKPSLTQLHVIPSSPVIDHQRQEISELDIYSIYLHYLIYV